MSQKVLACGWSSILLIPILQKTHGLAERCHIVAIVPCSQLARSYKHEIFDSTSPSWITSTTLLALACSKSTPDLKAAWLVFMGITGGKASHWTQSHCCKSVFWIAKSSQTSKPDSSTNRQYRSHNARKAAKLWNAAACFAKNVCVCLCFILEQGHPLTPSALFNHCSLRSLCKGHVLSTPRALMGGQPLPVKHL